MAKNAMSNGITSGRQLMRLRRVVLKCGDRQVELYETVHEGKKFTGTFRQCLLFCMGYGTDQAAELRYETAIQRKQNKGESPCCTKGFLKKD